MAGSMRPTIEGSINRAGGVAQGTANAATRQARPWLQKGARLGFLASGVVHITLGIIALQAAFQGGETTDSRGAITRLAAQPGGELLVLLVGVGLIANGIWRLIEAATGAEGEGNDAKGIGKRIGHAIAGVLYATLGVSALRIARGSSGGGGGSQADWTARLMEMPFGRFLVIAGGIGIVAYALFQLYRAATADVLKHMDLHDVNGETREWIVRLGRAGIGARGVVLTIIGGFLVIAAWRHDASQATGLDGALATLLRAPGGPWVLALVAIGFVAYGLFQIVRARYRTLAM